MKKSYAILALAGICIFLHSCSSSKTGTSSTATPSHFPQLRFLDTTHIPFGKIFHNTTVGGLSGIDFDKDNGIYYMICDDRSNINPARFYTAKIHFKENKFDSIQFLSVHFLKDSSGKEYPNARMDPYKVVDPESMRYWYGKNQLVWSSEGERELGKGRPILIDPSINITDTTGKWIGAFPIPSKAKMSSRETGPRQNGVFEGLSFTPDNKKLFVSIEEPLYQDGPRVEIIKNRSPIRILEYDVASKQEIHEYAYIPEPVAYPAIPTDKYKINGISEIYALNDQQIMVMERSYSTGHPNNVIRIFLADITNATDVKNKNSLAIKKYRPAAKHLLFNLSDLGIFIDNVEGICFGPKLQNGNQSVLLMVDNNFSRHEIAQVFLFEFIP